MPARERLFFEPLRNIWRWERLSEDDQILDFYELKASGIAARYNLDEIKANMAEALAILEAV